MGDQVRPRSVFDLGDMQQSKDDVQQASEKSEDDAEQASTPPEDDVQQASEQSEGDVQQISEKSANVVQQSHPQSHPQSQSPLTLEQTLVRMRQLEADNSSLQQGNTLLHQQNVILLAQNHQRRAEIADLSLDIKVAEEEKLNVQERLQRKEAENQTLRATANEQDAVMARRWQLIMELERTVQVLLTRDRQMGEEINLMDGDNERLQQMLRDRIADLEEVISAMQRNRAPANGDA